MACRTSSSSYPLPSIHPSSGASTFNISAKVDGGTRDNARAKSVTCARSRISSRLAFTARSISVGQISTTCTSASCSKGQTETLLPNRRRSADKAAMPVITCPPTAPAPPICQGVNAPGCTISTARRSVMPCPCRASPFRGKCAMSRFNALNQNGPTPGNRLFSSPARSKRLLRLGESSKRSAKKSQSFGVFDSPRIRSAKPAGYPNGKSNPISKRRDARSSVSTNSEIHSIATSRLRR